MKAFEIKKISAEIKNRNEIKTGCCTDDVEPESVVKFATLEAALPGFSAFVLNEHNRRQ